MCLCLVQCFAALQGHWEKAQAVVDHMAGLVKNGNKFYSQLLNVGVVEQGGRRVDKLEADPEKRRLLQALEDSVHFASSFCCLTLWGGAFYRM